MRHVGVDALPEEIDRPLAPVVLQDAGPAEFEEALARAGDHQRFQIEFMRAVEAEIFLSHLLPQQAIGPDDFRLRLAEGLHRHIVVEHEQVIADPVERVLVPARDIVRGVGARRHFLVEHPVAELLRPLDVLLGAGEANFEAPGAAEDLGQTVKLAHGPKMGREFEQFDDVGCLAKPGGIAGCFPIDRRGRRRFLLKHEREAVSFPYRPLAGESPRGLSLSQTRQLTAVYTTKIGRIYDIIGEVRQSPVCRSQDGATFHHFKASFQVRLHPVRDSRLDDFDPAAVSRASRSSGFERNTSKPAPRQASRSSAKALAVSAIRRCGVSP